AITNTLLYVAIVMPLSMGLGLLVALGLHGLGQWGGAWAPRLSNALKALLERYSAPAHGALLGLLVGSVLGLYPFQAAVHPELAHRPTRKAVEAVLLKGEDVAAAAAEVDGLDAAALGLHAEKWADSDKGALKRASLETRRFDPSGGRIARALGLFLAGFALTRLLGRRS
ncbi:MAG: hypothetical protein AAFZ87_02875, partial [Planctomycetota bacterium]